MDVTPSPKMFEAMSKMVDAICGEDPHSKMVGPGAERVRRNRRLLFDFLHQLVALSMREGAARATNPGRRTAMQIEIQKVAERLNLEKIGG